MNYLYKLEIELDDEKIISDGIYSLESIYDGIRSIFAEEGISEIKAQDKALVFASNNNDDKEFAKFGYAETFLIEQKWFAPYVKKMLWYDTLYDVESKEDVLRFFKEDGLI